MRVITPILEARYTFFTFQEPDTMIRRHAPIAAAFALLASPLFAQAPAWQIDPAHSAAQFAGRHMMVSTVRGQFNKLSGTVSWDGKTFGSASVEIVIDAASIDTREAKRDDHLRSGDFFDVAKFPTITFKSTRLDPAGEGKLRMTGDMTIHGVTRPVVFEVNGPTPAIKDQGGNSRVGASATTTINRKDFGLLWNRALDSGGVVVGDEVAVTVDIEMLLRASAPPTK
jgi:polyisoprenoid-binding protein YceI